MIDVDFLVIVLLEYVQMVILFFVVELVMIEVFLIKGGFLYMVIKEKLMFQLKIL